MFLLLFVLNGLARTVSVNQYGAATSSLFGFQAIVSVLNQK
jgi:hypothetical protein